MTDDDKLTADLVTAGATRDKVIEIINGYGDSIDWSDDSLTDIISEVWQSDINSGEDAENWIINDICSTFNVKEVTE
jgi:hypothetical protein